MAKCKDCGAVYGGMNHSVYACEERQAQNRGQAEYARFILKSADEGRVWIGESVRRIYEAEASEC